MSNDKKDCTWINNKLKEMLEKEPKYGYQALIKVALDSDSHDAKYDVLTLLMEHETDKIRIENLRNRLEHIYCEDKDLQEYINDLVIFSPKFNSVELTTRSRRDIRDDYSCYISVDKPAHGENDDVWFKNVSASEQKVKDYLRIILTDAKKLKE